MTHYRSKICLCSIAQNSHPTKHHIFFSICHPIVFFFSPQTMWAPPTRCHLVPCCVVQIQGGQTCGMCHRLDSCDHLVGYMSPVWDMPLGRIFWDNTISTRHISDISVVHMTLCPARALPGRVDISFSPAKEDVEVT